MAELPDGAIRLVFSLFAIVFVVESLVNAHATIVAMLKVIPASHAAKSAFRTMVGLIFIRHPKIANGAMIFSKLDIALNTSVAVSFKTKNCVRNKIEQRQHPQMHTFGELTFYWTAACSTHGI